MGRPFQLIVMLLALAATPALAAGSAVLKGLPRTGFAVKVEPLEPDARKAGLTEAGIGKVILSRMAKRKIASAANGSGEIYARVVVLTSNAVNGEVLGYGGHVEISFREKAVLKRDKLYEFMAPVWFKGNVTVANPKSFAAQVVNVVAGLTDEFLADFQRENP